MKSPNLQVFYEDDHIIVCRKPAKIATESSKIGVPDMVSILKNHISKTSRTSGNPYLAVIHRLDQPVSGILVFAKTPSAAKELNRQLTSREFGKYYLALVSKAPEPAEALLENYLIKDPKTNSSRICSADTPGAKRARLHYKLLTDAAPFFTPEQCTNTSDAAPALLEIHLDTGRHHQIRVQLAGIGCPIAGDTKYNPDACANRGWKSICLCAYKLSFRHPVTQEPLFFEISSSDSNGSQTSKFQFQRNCENVKKCK